MVLDAAALPSGDVGLTGRAFYRFATPAGDTVAYGGIEHHGTAALFRSIVVLPGQRGQGYGRAIVDHLVEQAQAAHVDEAYLLTASAGAFFEHLGFAVIDRATVPAAILGTTQAAGLCPAATPLLVKRLS
jgi:N-acetylglutamate synthase-like GNAT family acetyltransferase